MNPNDAWNEARDYQRKCDEDEIARITTQRDAFEARLASVTSAFLVLSHDKSITGGARKLIEKECELLVSNESGGHLIKKLVSLRTQLESVRQYCQKQCDSNSEEALLWAQCAAIAAVEKGKQ